LIYSYHEQLEKTVIFSTILTMICVISLMQMIN